MRAFIGAVTPPLRSAGVTPSAARARGLGVLTVGQSPRADVTPTLRSILGPNVEVREAGALDGLDTAAIEDLAPRPGETPLETRLGGGDAVVVSKDRIVPHLVARARELASTCDTVLLLCSGTFQGLADACPSIVEPGPILHAVVAGLGRRRRIGLVGPAADLERAGDDWAADAPGFQVAAASPYAPRTQLLEAGMQLVGTGADLVVLDDMAFTEEQRRDLAEATGLPVLCATTLTARVLCEIV